jgi:CHRD domain
MRKLLAIPLTLAVCGLIVAGSALAANKTITVKMNGRQETPKGSPTGSGTAKITLEPSKGKVCFRLTWSGIGSPTASHIHKGARGKAGNIVVALFGNPPAKHSGCVSAKKSLVSAIAKTPGAYYVNIHTKRYPAGAIRGQL